MEEGQQCFHPNGQTVISWPNKVDLSHLCRICANSSEYLISIFDGEGTENDLEFKIKKHLPIKISKEEPLPLSLCYQCASTLIAWHDLTLGCIEADKRLRALSQGSCKEESSAQFKVDDNDDNNESFRGASDCEIELEEEVTTTPSTSTQVEIDNLSTSIKVKKKIVNKSTLIKQESEKKQKQVKEDETKENASLIESTSSERYPITSKLIQEGEILESKIKMEYSFPLSFNEETLTARTISVPCLCEVCGKSFEGLSQYDKHKMKCKYSPKLILNNYNEYEDDIFKDQKTKVKDRVLYQCEKCGKCFKVRNSYNIHRRVHTGEKPYVCHMCGQNFISHKTLKCHLKFVHLGIKNYCCEICGRSFATKSSMEDHRRIHTGETPYVCHSCEKSFKTKSALYIHSKSHSDAFPYSCTQCERQFRRKHHLRNHLATHTGEKNHPCFVCGKSFRIKQDQIRHTKLHSGTKPYSCPVCGTMFAEKRYVTKHMKYHVKMKTINKNSETEK